MKIEYPYKKDQSNPEMKRRDAEIHIAKSQRILAERNRRKQNEPLDRQVKIENLLQELVDQGKKVKSSVV